jgi:hypothetical protein
VRRRLAAAGAALLALAPAAAGAGSTRAPGTDAPGCVLSLLEHRTGRALLRLPPPARSPEGLPELRLAFEHSVLGTTVVDRYRFTPQPLLVEEEFEGEGYGLPSAAGPGERLERVGARQRLHLQRPVDPLVVRALPAQRMRLLLPSGELVLAALGASAVEILAEGCEP